MALKPRCTKDEHAALSEAIQALYVADGDGFKLDLESVDPPQPKPPAAEAARIAQLEKDLAEARKPKPPATDGARLEKLEKELADEKKARRDEKFGRIVTEAITAAGFHPAAVPDVVSRVRSGGLELQDDGSVAAVADDAEPVGLGDYLKTVKREAPHLYAPPRGAEDRLGGHAKQPKSTLREATPESFAANAKAIAAGEMAVDWADA